MNQKGNSLIYILFGILLLTLVGGGAYYFGTQSAQQQISNIPTKESLSIQPSILPTNTPISSPTAAINIPSVKLLPVSGWATSFNDVFSLKYPSNRFNSEVDKQFIQLSLSSDNSTGPDFLIANNYTGGSRRQWYLQYFSYNDSDVGKTVFFTEKMLGNIDAIEVTSLNKYVSNILVAKGNTLINVATANEELNLVETMVSTITFK